MLWNWSDFRYVCYDTKSNPYIFIIPAASFENTWGFSENVEVYNMSLVKHTVEAP